MPDHERNRPHHDKKAQNSDDAGGAPLRRKIENTPRGAGGEIQLTDGMVRLIGRQAFHGLRYEGLRYDCGDKIGFLEANLAFGLARDDVAPQLRQIMTQLLSSKS